MIKKENMNITEPFFDNEELRMVQETLDSKWVTQGAKTKEFEDLMVKEHMVKYALATTSCTAALHLSSLALDIKPGDEVIVPAFTWITSASAIEYVGAKAVFADIDLNTFNINPSAVKNALTKKTKAIVVVHLFGKAAPMDEIMKIACENNLTVIEDAACAIGTKYKSIPVGGIGDLGCFSFHPRKVITTGEGGMVTTNNLELAKKIQSLRNHGATGMDKNIDPTRPYAMSNFDMLGYNLRISDIQAAVGIAQMAKLKRLLTERRRLALNYSKLMSNFKDIILPLDDSGHTYQSYVIRMTNEKTLLRNQIMDHLISLNIQTRPGTHAVHRLGYFKKKYNLQDNDFMNAIKAEDTSITLPIFPGMTNNQQEIIISNIKKMLK
jgi:perosamine synthetase